MPKVSVLFVVLLHTSNVYAKYSNFNIYYVDRNKISTTYISDAIPCTSEVECAAICNIKSCCSASVSLKNNMCVLTPLHLCFDVPRSKDGWNVIVQGSQQCPNNWREFNTMCFYFSDFEKEWMSAMKLCEEMNSILAEPKTRENINFLRSIAKGLGKIFWIGGTDKQKESEWIWASSKTQITETDWYSSEPNNRNGIEHCLSIYKPHDSYWNDDDCENRQRFICEMNPMAKK